MMRIGIDIDGVLTNVEQFSIDYFSKYCFENNIEYNIGESHYNISETFGVSSKQEDDFWDKYLEFYAVNEKARPFASEVIKKLKKDGHEIYIVTARWLTNRDDSIGENMRKIVKKWLLENEIIYDKLIFSKGLKEKKHQEVIENKIDLMIEDNPSNINELSRIVPVICYDTTYNKNCSNNKIFRCYSWYDIYRKLKEISNNDI